jgi:hypothetical protein
MLLAEAAVGAAVGYLIAVVTQVATFPMFGLVVGMVQNLGIGVVFTAVSIARSYSLRGLFERSPYAGT